MDWCALFTSLTSYRSWLIELVRVTARQLGSSVTLLVGAPDPYGHRMIKSDTLRPVFRPLCSAFCSWFS
ncbi:pentatricopeptide repeat-containing protein [Corchorus olitorius]|uniref:Pentatricopeptide repeat-containing protein n=1 Tax=Corchorus olitorius TaxID=93759 RepID=A0A1R3KZ63_9ROSI|nr:pentatricopeptide repeat-containing protein [Corchorus olitorius]